MNCQGIHINSAGGRPLPDGWFWEIDGFQDFDLWFCRSGGGKFRANGRSISFSAGDCFVIPPGLKVSVKGNVSRRRSKPLDHWFVHFQVAKSSSSRGVGWDLFRSCYDSRFIDQALRRVVQSFLRGDEDEANTWLRGVLGEIAQQDDAKATTDIPADQMNAIKAICDDIHQDPGAVYRIADLAEQVHLSVEQFHRVFRKVTGGSPGDYVIDSRIQAAKELLVRSNLGIQEIAHTLGYRDIFFFSKQFKQRTGIAPSHFRANGVKDS